MLSILIPTYNYNAYPLVLELQRQALKSGIVFELLCIDDGSTSVLNIENQNINELEGCQFKEIIPNRGRTALRQYLTEQAIYDWVLFLDADTMPTNQDYIEKYLKVISKNYDAVFGGIAYEIEPPAANQMLRWRYGHQNETVSASVRNNKPYKNVVSANFMIKNQVFKTINSKITEKGYGFDNYFGALLKHNKLKVFHVDNPVYHLGLDLNSDFLKKVDEAIETLLKLYKENKIIESDNKLLKTFIVLRKFKLHYIMASIFKRSKSRLTKNLLSANPSVKTLQFYKLGYICFKDLN